MKIIVMFLALLCLQMAYGENDLHHANHEQKHSEAHENKKPSLDYGAKWKMDSHTRKMFVAMSERVHVGGDLKKVGEKLKEDLQKLIKGCTMTGEAHDQLHLFLASYFPAVRKLSEEGTEEAFQKVKHVLLDYQSYFE
ncbi:MAG: hypothetical protein K6L75_11995 [Cellvibrionaceae bacterium]